VIRESSLAAPRYLADLLRNGTPAGLRNAELLDRFESLRCVQDETAELAFAALLARRGPMVLRVCRAVLGSRDPAMPLRRCRNRWPMICVPALFQKQHLLIGRQRPEIVGDQAFQLVTGGPDRRHRRDDRVAGMLGVSQ
jgi:hypothetical protein